MQNKPKLKYKKVVKIHNRVKRFVSLDGVKMLLIDELLTSHELHESKFISDTTHNVLFTTLTNIQKNIKLL
ncbi:hypothetical protein Omtje3_5 [Cellulophaga phage Omtje_3]|uniref:Uncharacterized protein n=1 Tax=Cellulophaga phage Omtje_1 TaxID=2745694 RepID=A0A8E4ZCD6_9VIRU|nr:hypothetical protein Omtje1_5 [Cellulophaga phage Omtje_1]QQV90365.1 hypothetical protein Omtje2_5 [Cellulophaga phage Omtje_2]QQV90378.1 hypothetical protein Omtje3_5 [Cellulophaga phage Omtje_3]QQV90391.1 hypothetical protein Omtje4_5 [Cellulophaga phage Omtje_4]QQV90404.1 hypothetical protein Omtje5_5 [Cellulophaga phage Omtje_5]